jgi:hypothetical protein
MEKQRGTKKEINFKNVENDTEEKKIDTEKERENERKIKV